MNFFPPLERSAGKNFPMQAHSLSIEIDDLHGLFIFREEEEIGPGKWVQL
jgi:hypothetical protein